MGIFDFFKKFSEKREVENIKFEEMDSWIDSWSMKQFEGIKSELANIREKMIMEKEKSRKNIQRLREGEVKNKNLPDKVKYMVDDNRKIYIQKTENLLEKFDIPNKVDEIQRFCDLIDKELDFFGKNTLRNHVILQEFFGNEVSDISDNIRILSEMIKKARGIENSPMMKNVERLKNNFFDLQQKIKSKKMLEKEIDITKGELGGREISVKEKEKEINEVEEGSRYKKFMGLVRKKEMLENEIKEIEEEPFNLFSMINPALRKYERMTLDEKLVRKYLENSLKALLEDKEFKILDVLEKMKKLIIEGKIELKEKKKDKILLELEKIEKSYFEEFIKMYSELRKKIDELKMEMDKEKIIEGVEKLKEELKKNEIDVEDIKRKIGEMVKKFEDIDINGLKKDFKEKMNTNADINIKIV